MTKGEKYRAYYLKNRERILTANKERNRERREAIRDDGDAIAERRHRDRENYIKRRAAMVKKHLMTHAVGEATAFFTTLANAPDLHLITRRQLEWLLRCVPVPQNIPMLVIEEIDGSDIPYASDNED
jgi:hypothetical protein